MRKIISITAVIAALVSIWSAAIITTNHPGTTGGPASSPISVMQLMKDAKNLPDQQFDTH
jgi:hypothetical protein